MHSNKSSKESNVKRILYVSTPCIISYYIILYYIILYYIILYYIILYYIIYYIILYIISNHVKSYHNICCWHKYVIVVLTDTETRHTKLNPQFKLPKGK